MPGTMFCQSLNFPEPGTRVRPSQMFKMNEMDGKMSGWADGRSDK